MPYKSCVGKFIAGDPASVVNKWKKMTRRYRNSFMGHITGINTKLACAPALAKVDEDWHPFLLAYPYRHTNPYFWQIRKKLIDDATEFVLKCGGSIKGKEVRAPLAGDDSWKKMNAGDIRDSPLKRKDAELRASENDYLQSFILFLNHLIDGHTADEVAFGTYVGPVSYTVSASGICEIHRTVANVAQTLVIFASRLSFASSEKRSTSKHVQIINVPKDPRDGCEEYISQRLASVAKVVENPMTSSGVQKEVPEYLIFPPSFSAPDAIAHAVSASGLLLNVTSPSAPTAQIDILFKTGATPLPLRTILTTYYGEQYKQIYIITEQAWQAGTYTPHFAGDGSRNFLGAHRAKA